jgi:hypothetical protein
MKNLTQIVPDFREALEEGVQEAAEQVVFDLKHAGPQWTGVFETLWQVNAGNYAVKPNVANPLEVPKQAVTKSYSKAEVPESPKLAGYTIGNRAKYRLYAMDILGDPLRGDKKGRTAAKNWYETYINSKMRTVVNKSIQNVFRRYS